MRQLENQFIHQYGQTWGEEDGKQGKQDQPHDARLRSSGNGSSENSLQRSTAVDDASQQQQQQISNTFKRQKLAPPDDSDDDFTDSSLQDAGATPGSWSLSLTSKGLTINVAAKRIADFTLFAKDFSKQLYSHNPENLIDYEWDTIDDEELDDENELDEDEYMVTVPIVCIHHLVAKDSRFITGQESSSKIYATKQDEIDQIRLYLNDILIFINKQIKSLQADPFQSSTLLQQIQPFIPYNKQPSALNHLDFLCITTAFASLFYRCSSQSSFPPSFVQLCIRIANATLVDNLFQDAIQQPAFAICAGLLSWMQRSHHLFEIAVMSLSSIDESNRQKMDFQVLAGALSILQVYLSTFSCEEHQCTNQEGVDWLYKRATKGPLDQSKECTLREKEFFQALKLCGILRRVLTLFYTSETNPSIRKIDVDEVFDLVRDIEKWEQGLAGWAEWSNRRSDFKVVRYKVHLMHNITKVLFFRPFCTKRPTDVDEEIEQTHTRTTFLDLSLAAADRLATCVYNLSLAKEGKLDEWEQAGVMLVQDTIQHAKQVFPCDQELNKQLLDIKDRLDKSRPA